MEFIACSKDPKNINIETDDDALKQVPKFVYIVDLEKLEK
jgi:hypothetical protein